MFAEGPRVVNVDLIVYDVTVGRGTEDDPMRVVRYIGLPDGTKLCRWSAADDSQVFYRGFQAVHDAKEGGHEQG